VLPANWTGRKEAVDAAQPGDAVDPALGGATSIAGVRAMALAPRRGRSLRAGVQGVRTTSPGLEDQPGREILIQPR